MSFKQGTKRQRTQTTKNEFESLASFHVLATPESIHELLSFSPKAYHKSTFSFDQMLSSCAHPNCNCTKFRTDTYDVCSCCNHSLLWHHFSQSKQRIDYKGSPINIALDYLLCARMVLTQKGSFIWCSDLIHAAWKEICTCFSKSGQIKKFKKRRKNGFTKLPPHLSKLFLECTTWVRRISLSLSSLSSNWQWKLIRLIAAIDDFFYRIYYDVLTLSLPIDNCTLDPIHYLKTSFQASASADWIHSNDITQTSCDSSYSTLPELPGISMIRIYIKNYILVEVDNTISRYTKEIMTEWQMFHIADILNTLMKDNEFGGKTNVNKYNPLLVGGKTNVNKYNPLLEMFQLQWGESVILLSGDGIKPSFILNYFKENQHSNHHACNETSCSDSLFLEKSFANVFQARRRKTIMPKEKQIGCKSSLTLVCICCFSKLFEESSSIICDHCEQRHCVRCSNQCTKCSTTISTKISGTNSRCSTKKPVNLCRLCIQDDPSCVDTSACLCPYCASPVSSPDLAAFRESQKNWLARLYSFAIPTKSAIDIIIQYTPNGVVEIGSGTGYWAWILRNNGIPVAAYDKCPTAVYNRCTGIERRNTRNDRILHNEYHGCVPAFTHVHQGGPRSLKRRSNIIRDMKPKPLKNKSSTTKMQYGLLLCYPPPNDEMALQCLQAFDGEIIYYIGEWNGFTGTRRFEKEICNRFQLINRIRLPNWANSSCDLTVWRRNSGEKINSNGRIFCSGCCTDHINMKSITDTKIEKPKQCVFYRCRFCRDMDATYCSPSCAKKHARIHKSIHAIRMILLPRGIPSVMQRIS